MSAKRLGLLLTLTIIATTVDWVVLSNNWVFPLYHYLGWTTVWLLVFFIMQKRWLDSIVTVAIISVIEDFFYLTYGSLIGARAFYPLYCHAWIPDVYGSWAAFLGQDWLGMPSCYFIISAVTITYVLLKERRATKLIIDNGRIIWLFSLPFRKKHYGLAFLKWQPTENSKSVR
jgi:hypothetical protein